MLQKPLGLVSEIHFGGVRYGMKEAPSTTGITFARIYFTQLRNNLHLLFVN